MRGKAHKAPILLLELALLLFGRKKPPQEEKPPSTASIEPFPVPDIMKKTVTESDVSKARERLRVTSLERDIVGDALTKIYEAEAKGQITEAERNQLAQRYKVDLKRVDGEIDTHKKVVDLHELESAKEDLLKSFNEKLMEIDARINQIKPSITQITAQEAKAPVPTPQPVKAETPPNTPTQATTNKDKPPREKPKNKAEERLEAIREEVLKAMERLEQIETEG
ncbi:MAG TPA: hypothetical protein VI816_02155 [Candidatus Bathyarchaeia archaeon]|nr:hypothetical protein [Candidatus Bathyarchaeia archaeon]